MAPRDTTTGHDFEKMVVPALERGGYSIKRHVSIGDRPGGGAHEIDIIASKNAIHLLVSLKWQQVRGTAEQKVPFEAMCLGRALRTGQYRKAYLVLGGHGWTLRQFFVSGGLKEYLKNIERVQIIDSNYFIASANTGNL